MSTEFGGSWWGQRWIEALERLSTAWQNRLPRGRDYALKGHVISLAVTSGKITARVQGSRSKPYSTTIEVPSLRDADWDQALEKLSAEARFPAQLLVGIMPTDIEAIFSAENVNLFPMRNSEMLGSCTCPDKARPCKHIAAVHYAFGQALDRDPFLLFQLRGADRVRMLSGFYKAWFDEVPPEAEIDPQRTAADRGLPVQPLFADRFNRSPEPLDGMSFMPFEEQSARLIVERLSAPRSWTLPIGITDLLGPVYDEVTALASKIAVDGFDADLLAEAENNQAFADSFDDSDYDDDRDGYADDDESNSESDDSEAVARVRPKAKPEESAFQSMSFATPKPEPTKGDNPLAKFSLPSALSMKPSVNTPKPALNEEPAPESKVLIRKGVAAMSRRRKQRVGAEVPDAKSRGKVVKAEKAEKASAAATSGAAADTATDAKGRKVVSPKTRKASMADSAAPTTAPSAVPSDFVESTKSPGSPAVVRRKRSSVGGDNAVVPVVRRRRAVIPTSGLSDAPGAASADLGAADAITLIALGQDKYDHALKTVVDAWRVEPTLARFQLMMTAAEGAERVDETLEAEAEQIIAENSKRTLHSAELLLIMSAGRYKDAADRVRSLGKRAWKGTDSPAATFLPFACAAAGSDAAGNSYIKRTFDSLASRGEGAFATLTTPARPAGVWLSRALDSTPPSESDLARLLSVSRELTLHMLSVPRIDSSGAKADAAAATIVATAEALACVSEEGHSFLADCSKQLDPKRRLTISVGKAVSQSPVLS
ncbi:MAG: putative Zn finger protein [Bradymonadia bacterium]|jgi:uncharacterized Zn finger protein